MKILLFVVLMTGQFIRPCESYDTTAVPLPALELHLDNQERVEINLEKQESDVESNRAHSLASFAFDPEQSIEDNTRRFHENFLKKRNRLTFMCCEKAFAWKLFCRHVAHKHSSPNSVSCPVKECKKTFTTVGHGYLHIALHQYPDLLACPVCNDQLSAVCAAKKHVMRCWKKKYPLGTQEALYLGDEPVYKQGQQHYTDDQNLSSSGIHNTLHQSHPHNLEYYSYNN